MSRLVRRVPLTITRASEGQWDTSGRFTEGVREDISVRGSVQPFKTGTSQLTLPEGLRSEDAVILYTETPLQTVNQFGKTLADEAVVDGRTYTALDSANWSRNGLRTDHYKVLFVRNDKMSNGGL